MWVSRVKAVAFGPLADREMELASGLNIVTGPNEAGKSSWHAAVAACLTGPGSNRRRGRPTKEDTAFTEAHRPWAGDAWTVRAEVAFDDETRIELVHDMESRSSRANDLNTGRDLTQSLRAGGDDIDLSRRVGLTRSSFPLVAQVGQNEILKLKDSAKDSELQTLVDKAATRQPSEDHTARAARDRINKFLTDNVGQDRKGSGKPLPAAIRGVEEAENALSQVQRQRDELVSRKLAVSESRTKAERLAQRVAAIGATIAEQNAAKAEREHSSLAEAFRELGDEPAEPPHTERLAEVEEVLADWRSAPAAIHLSGDTAEDLRMKLDSLPAMPEGDLEPSEGVLAAKDAFDRATLALEACRLAEPVAAEHRDDPSIAPSRLRDLAHVLDEKVAEPDLDLTRRLREVNEALDSRPGGFGDKRLATAVIATGVGLAAIALFTTPVLWGVAALVVGVGVFLGTRQPKVPQDLLRQQAELNARVEQDERRRQAAEKSRTTAVNELAEAGLDPDPDLLRSAASDIESAAERMAVRAAWQGRFRELEADLARCRSELVQALAAVGVSDTDPAVAFDTYRRMCAERRDAATRAGGRTALAQALRDREAREQEARSVDQQREGLECRLRNLGGLVGLSAYGTAEDLAANLRNWAERTRNASDAVKEHRQRARELHARLNGRTLDDLAQSYRELRERARQAAEGTELLSDPMTEDDLLAAQKLAAQAKEEADQLDGGFSEAESALPSVSRAKEELSAAKRELERVRTLDRRLREATRHLERAEQQAQQTLAPLLRQAVTRHVGEVTGGRYTDVSIDPKDMTVRVRLSDSSLVEAHRLSHGTAEQIYLLLRAALAEAIGAEEACPLILDDVVVHADADRTIAMLEVLHHISKERQVILFSQETQVAAWAEANLGECDRWIELDVLESA